MLHFIKLKLENEKYCYFCLSDWIRTQNKRYFHYRNDPKFSDRYVWANSINPDQTARRGAV